ncbi:MAG: MFS transporter [Gammaproteobacteria bacterium]|nr:MFS transporter [Gammaproteobacteria bacterium]
MALPSMDSNELTRQAPLLLAACVGVICSSIVLPFYTMGLFVGPVTETFGWSRSEFQLSLLFSTGFGVVTSPLVGWLIHRFGPRPVALFGIVGLSLAFLMPALTTGTLWQFYLAYSAMAFLGAGTIPVTWTTAVTANFHIHRGLALGLVLSGTGLCAVLVPPVIAAVMAEYGWRMGYVALALIPLFIAGPIVFTFFRPAPIASETDPSSATQSWGLTLSDAMKRYRFWVLLGSIFLVYIAQSGLVPNLIPALTDTGISPTDAAQTMSLFGAAVIIGRLTIGFCVDRFWAPGVAAVALLLPVIGCFLLWQDLTLANARIAAVLLGFAAGAELDLMAFLAATYFGPRHYPKIYGVLYAALASASGIAPALFAEIYEQTQSYTIGFATGAAAFTVAVILVLMLGRYPPEAKTIP